MILIVASRVDDAARRLLRNLPGGSARLLTPLDLSQPGWRVFSARPSENLAVAAGAPLEPQSVSGVVCLLPRIFARELVQIEAADRAYVAAEMTAFLTYWLSTLTCRKLNPPTPGCLSGPSWTAEHWLRAAAAAGLPVVPLHRKTRAPGSTDGAGSRSVTVIGTRCLGDSDPVLADQARALAAHAGVDLLTVHFADADGRVRFSAVEPFPDLSEPQAAAAIHDFFCGESA